MPAAVIFSGGFFYFVSAYNNFIEHSLAAIRAWLIYFAI
jgi:hypothetical protein